MIDKGCLLPLSGYEYDFTMEPWLTSPKSANCYSYALGHFKLDSKRKPQPGDIARSYDDLRSSHELNREGSWRNCGDIRKRVDADGIACWRLLGFKGDGSTIRRVQFERPAPAGFYKIVAVTDGADGEDYHFYRQDSAKIAEVYKAPLYCYMNDVEFRSKPNAYEALGIDPFISGNHLEELGPKYEGPLRDAYRTISGEADLGNVPKELVRSATNLKIHTERLPEHVIRAKFIPDPFWIVGVNAFNPNARDIARTKYEALRMLSLNELEVSTLDAAHAQCEAIISNPSSMPKKQFLIGLFSHKLGWATNPINTDSDGKLIFDPRHAAKKHASIDYSNACTAFAVMRGQGLATAPT